MIGMLERIRKARRSESGFSLIELLIVIVVLGVLGGIVVFGVGTFRSDSELAACKAEKKTVEVAAQAWRAKNGSWPADVTALVSSNYLEKAPTNTFTLSSTGLVTSTLSGC